MNSYTKPAAINDTMTVKAVNTWRHSAPAPQQRPSSRMGMPTGHTMSRPMSYPKCNTSVNVNEIGQYHRQMRPPIPTFSRAAAGIADDDDAKSIWSDDDQASVVSAATAHGKHIGGGFDCGDSVLTGIETLVCRLFTRFS